MNEQEKKVLQLCRYWYQTASDISRQTLWYEIGVMLENENAAQQSVQPTDGDVSQNNVVYSHLGCIFRYCPNPDVCRKSEGGCMHPVSG